LQEGIDMDPVTTAIISALAAGIGKGATDVVKNAIVDGYQGLKLLLKRKFGDTSEIAKAVENLEKKPDSAGRQQTVAEEISNVKAATDPDVVAAAKELLANIETQPGGKQQIQKIVGNYNAAVIGNGTANVNVFHLPDKQDG
jgi:hypothetical protein